jgi:hypothetical protein
MQPRTKTELRRPFHNMPPGAWGNLALVCILSFYFLQVAGDYLRSPLCKNLGEDYCSFWAAGKISNEHGYASIYDLPLTKQYEDALYPIKDDPYMQERMTPFIYLPVFILPFQLFALLPLVSSYWIWTLVNLIGLILYLRFFTKKLTGQPLPARLLLLSALCVPVINTLFWGQLNILLAICTGEFLRAYVNGKPLRAGFWLGGLLLKFPQLILILPFLLLKKSWKTLSGYLLSSATLLFISYLMVGFEGFRSLFKILVTSSMGGSASNPRMMVNWRMLGFHLSSVTSQKIILGVIILGTLVTLIATWWLARRYDPSDKAKSAIIILGIFTATELVTWHAHFTTTIILIPFFLFLNMQNQTTRKLFHTWALLPIAFMLILLALTVAFGLTSGITLTTSLQLGIVGFILNLAIITWVLFACMNEKPSVKASTQTMD